MLANASKILTSPGLVLGLAILLTNDFYLKTAFPGHFTGKLSDFAGLFSFALFWIALVPRHRRAVCLAVAFLFVIWKSSYSGPTLDVLNEMGLPFSRTVDLTDLIALVVLPAAYFYSGKRLYQNSQVNWSAGLIALVAVFAFTATSYQTAYDDYSNRYYFPGPKSELFDKIDALRLDYFDLRVSKEARETGRLTLRIPASICFDSIDARLELTEEGNQTIVSIKELEHQCPQHDGDRDELLAVFEKEVIERLKNNTPQTKHWKSSVDTPGFKQPPAQSPSHPPTSPERAPKKS